MPNIMKTVNNISRCQAIYRNDRLAEDGAFGLSPCQHTFVLAICRAPGRTQEELSKDICLNKSTVARTLTQLEERGFVRREQGERDKRCLLIYPTEKMLSIHSAVKLIAGDFTELVLNGVGEEERRVFEGVLAKMEANAKAAAGIKEDRE